MSLRRLDGKVAIVAGASQGIGAATARVLADAGCFLALTAREEEWLEMTARNVRKRGGRAIAVAADITDLEMVEEVVESALGEYDRVDMVVNAAGMAWPIDLAADADAEEWAYSIHTNLVGPFYLVNNVLPVLLEQGSGRIVNLTCHSGAGLRRGVSALRAAKAGLEVWSQTVALELDGTGVSIMCLDPGVVDTATRREIVEMDGEDAAVDVTSWLPYATAADLCRPEEAARMVYWLLAAGDVVENGRVYRGADTAWREMVSHDLGDAVAD